MCTKLYYAQCAVHVQFVHAAQCALNCAGLVDPASRCQMAASSTTTGNNCQCHSACKDDIDDDDGGNHQMMMMMMCRGISGKGQVDIIVGKILSGYLVCHAQVRWQKYFWRV